MRNIWTQSARKLSFQSLQCRCDIFTAHKKKETHTKLITININFNIKNEQGRGAHHEKEGGNGRIKKFAANFFILFFHFSRTQVNEFSATSDRVWGFCPRQWRSSADDDARGRHEPVVACRNLNISSFVVIVGNFIRDRRSGSHWKNWIRKKKWRWFYFDGLAPKQFVLLKLKIITGEKLFSLFFR